MRAFACLISFSCLCFYISTRYVCVQVFFQIFSLFCRLHIFTPGFLFNFPKCLNKTFIIITTSSSFQKHAFARKFRCAICVLIVFFRCTKKASTFFSDECFRHFFYFLFQEQPFSVFPRLFLIRKIPMPAKITPAASRTPISAADSFSFVRTGTTSDI